MAAAAFPKPILLEAVGARDSGMKDGDAGRNGVHGWLYSRDADMVRDMRVNNRGGILQWSREASHWLRENHLSPRADAPQDTRYRGCLAPVGASLHVVASNCRASTSTPGGGAGGGSEDDDDDGDLCHVSFEHSLYFRAAQRCPPHFLAEKAQREGAPRLRVVVAKGLDSGTWISDDLDAKHSSALAFSCDLQERAAGFFATITARTAVGTGFHRTLASSLVPLPAGTATGGGRQATNGERGGEEGGGDGEGAGASWEGCEVVMLDMLPREYLLCLGGGLGCVSRASSCVAQAKIGQPHPIFACAPLLKHTRTCLFSPSIPSSSCCHLLHTLLPYASDLPPGPVLLAGCAPRRLAPILSAISHCTPPLFVSFSLPSNPPPHLSTPCCLSSSILLYKFG